MDTEHPELGLNTLHRAIVIITFKVCKVHYELRCKCQKYDIGQTGGTLNVKY
jgi:hypothetical protein